MPSDDQEERIIQLLEELLKWVRLEGAQKAKTTLEALLVSDLEKLVYQYSDGRTSREIAASVGTSHVTIVRYWKRWSVNGIVEEVSSQGGNRYKRVFSLPDFGIEIPEIPRQGSVSAGSDNRSEQLQA